MVGINSEHHQKEQVFAECKLDVRGKTCLLLEEDSVYKAIDMIRDYLELELKNINHMTCQRKDKITRKTRIQIEL